MKEKKFLKIIPKDSGTDDLIITLNEGANYTSDSTSLKIKTDLANIYGVEWNKSINTKFTRTDNSRLFIDPVPGLNGGYGNSPFDNLMPWAGMIKTTIDDNEFVTIPKFWFKWTNTEDKLKLQIADKPVEGFSVSPSHMDRGDGKGERDTVYVACYHCSSDWKSQRRGDPIVNTYRKTGREGIRKLGENYFMEDYAMWWTIRMLYLVEFADWDSQSVIGYGGGNGSSMQQTGYYSPSYHTCTYGYKDRSDSSSWVYYRNIEGLWSNAEEWIDGIWFDSKGNIYVTNNPLEYDDSAVGTIIGTITIPESSYKRGCIADWTIPTEKKCEWALFPSKTFGQMYSRYCADEMYISNSGGGLIAGAYYYNNPTNDYPDGSHGLFYYQNYSSYGTNIGFRLQYLP